MTDSWTQRHQVGEGLEALERALDEAGLWTAVAPPESAFESSLPFCYDTMFVSEWLQWVFIPKMRELLATGAVLPERCRIAPYAEEAFAQRSPPQAVLLIACLRRLDRLISGETD